MNASEDYSSGYSAAPTEKNMRKSLNYLMRKSKRYSTCFRQKVKNARAVVAANDEIAAGICDAAALKKIIPGTDFGLIGFDDNSKYRKYNLTSISPPLEKIGVKLAELVIDNLDNRKKRRNFNNTY